MKKLLIMIFLLGVVGCADINDGCVLRKEHKPATCWKFNGIIGYEPDHFYVTFRKLYHVGNHHYHESRKIEVNEKDFNKYKPGDYIDIRDVL